MINTPAICAKCASVDLQRNGTRDGYARYRCTACGHQARLVPAAVARTARYAQVDRLLAERNSQRSIVRVTGVSRVTVARLAKKSTAARVLASAPTQQKGAEKAVGSARTRRNVDVCGPQAA